ncbi:MAG: histidine kinase, partial [Bacteroidales bacterium]|nr:histidine kinase [Bacteroidales bacterium]
MCKFPGSVIFSDRTVFRIGRHLFLFVAMNLLFTWVLMMRGDNAGSLGDAMQNVFVNSIFFFGYAYITAYLLVPRFLTKGRYLLFAFLFFFAGITLSWLKFIFSDYVFYTAIGGDLALRIIAPDLSQILVNTKDMTFIVALFLIAKYTKDNYTVRNRLAHLQDDQIRSEIRLLRNQLDPHVVFNNLNNLYTLGVNYSPEVFVNLGRLRSVLSYYLLDGSKSKVKFSRELQAIGDFLALEKLRYGERLA